MTRLIGGTINNTPIKDIGDGSAFSVGGGGGGKPSPKTLSVASTATSISGWTDAPVTQQFSNAYSGVRDYCKLTDSKWIFVWRSNSDNKAKAAIITFDSNNDPTFGSQTSLTAFTDSTKGPVWVYRVSDTRVLIMSAVVISTYLTYQIQVYDISGTTITAASGLSLQSVTMQKENYDYTAKDGCLIVIDENRAVLSTTDYYRSGNNDYRRYFYGIRFTATQNVGSAIDFGPLNAGTGYDEGSDQVPILISSTKFFQGDIYSVSTIDVDASSTPVVSNLVVVNSNQTFPFGGAQQNSYLDERRLRVLPDDPVEITEQFSMSRDGGTVFGHYSGVSDNTKTIYSPRKPLNYVYNQSRMKDTTFMLLSQSGTVHYCLYSENLSGLNARIYQPMVIDTNDHFVGYGFEVQLATGITTDTNGFLGGIIRPNASATRLTVFEYQTAATAGWYYATIDVT
jgi:hypothetical protein